MPIRNYSYSKNKSFGLFFFIFIFSFFSHAQDLPFQDLIIENKNTSHLKEFISSFRGVGYLEKSDKFRYYDADLNLIAEYDKKHSEGGNIYIENNGVAKTQVMREIDGRKKAVRLFGFYNDDFKNTIPFQYKNIIHYQGNEYLYALTKDDKLKIFNIDGKEIYTLPENHTISKGIIGNTFIFYHQTPGSSNISGIMDVSGKKIIEIEQEEGTVLSHLIDGQYFILKKEKTYFLVNLDKEVLWSVEGHLQLVGNTYFIHSIRGENRSNQLLNIEGKAIHEDDYIESESYNYPLIYSNNYGGGKYIVFDKKREEIASFDNVEFDPTLEAFICNKNDDRQNESYIKDGVLYNDKASFYKKLADNTFNAYPFRLASERYGLMNKDMKIIMEAKYKKLSPINLSTGLLEFQDFQKKNGIINTKGEIVIEAAERQFFHITKDGIIIKKQNGKHTFLDKDLEIIISPFDHIDEVRVMDEETVAFHKKRKAQKAPGSGGMRPPPPSPMPPSARNSKEKETEYINTLSGSRLLKYGWHYMSANGKILFNGGYYKVNPFVDGAAMVHSKSYRDTSMIDKKGEIIDTEIDVEQYTEAAKNKTYIFNRAFGVAPNIAKRYSTELKDNRLVFSEHSITFPDIASELVYYHPELSICKTSQKYQQIDLEKENAGLETYADNLYFYENYLLFKKMGKTGIMNDKGKVIVKPSIYFVGILEGKALIIHKKKFYLLDLSKG